MSSLALLLKEKGENVRGSDVKDYIFTEDKLKQKGVEILEFNKDNITCEDIVIIGHDFIDSDNEEVVKAKKHNTFYEYNKFISEFIKDYYSIAVSGSHGKTTTTSLIANALNEIDECGYLIGDGSSSISPISQYFVFEACEYKEHFLEYKSNIILINNIDYDHVDYFKNELDYVKAFYKFVNNAKDKVIVNGDDFYLSNIKNAFTYGLKENNNLIAKNIVEDENGISYDVYYNGYLLKRVSFPFYGRHMVYNTLSAMAVCLYLKINIEIIEKGLNKFKGVNRRFNERIFDDSVFIDDYAHHPSEIEATLKAVKQKYKDKKIIAFYKGDRYSRVYKFAKEIVKALFVADDVYVLPFPSCSKKEDGIDIDEKYLSLFNEKIKYLKGDEYYNLACYKDTVYVFMSSKNTKEEQNKIIELKAKLRKQ